MSTGNLVRPFYSSSKYGVLNCSFSHIRFSTMFLCSQHALFLTRSLYFPSTTSLSQTAVHLAVAESAGMNFRNRKKIIRYGILAYSGPF
jgi:hypothetical protein